MGLRSYLGLGSSKSSSSDSSNTTTRSSGSGSTGGWYSPDVPLPQVREVHPAPAEYTPDGTRRLSPKPDPAHVNATFWRS
ncbi:hypothetical protein [Kitasatospora sp. NPDC057223]|uniref:hypothetical protein n=1 Tax=Kitasatospora sp. NPDC057223 TaxID=3346055 RepID=UPI003643940C